MKSNPITVTFEDMDYYGDGPKEFRVKADELYAGRVREEDRGFWVFMPDEPWYSAAELMAIGKALKEFDPYD